MLSKLEQSQNVAEDTEIAKDVAGIGFVGTYECQSSHHGYDNHSLPSFQLAPTRYALHTSPFRPH